MSVTSARLGLEDVTTIPGLWHLAGVCEFHVIVELHDVTESFSTSLACVRLLSSVKANMALVAEQIIEYITALATSELHFWVRVVLLTEASTERFTTHVTLVRLASSVNQQVALKKSRTAERLLAAAAREKLLSNVTQQMLL